MFVGGIFLIGTQGSISGDCLPLLVSQPLVNQHLFYTYSISADDGRAWLVKSFCPQKITNITLAPISGGFVDSKHE